jgi:hypothetical protein
MVILGAQAIPYLSALVGALVAHYSKDHPVVAAHDVPAPVQTAAIRTPETVEAQAAAT